MHYAALATNYDGTLATKGKVQPRVTQALRDLKESGRKLILVTGREMKHIREAFPEYAIFDMIVAENGALLFDPRSNAEIALTGVPSEPLVAALRAQGVGPISVGRGIIATSEPHEMTVLCSIRELNLELEMIFNKGAIMILPTGVNKASGLKAALALMDLNFENVVAIGDAENDHTLLKVCGFAVAVNNAIPSIKEASALVTRSERGLGVIELIEEMIAHDMAIYTTKDSVNS